MSDCGVYRCRVPRGYRQNAGLGLDAGCRLMQQLASTSRCLDERRVHCSRVLYMQSHVGSTLIFERKDIQT